MHDKDINNKNDSTESLSRNQDNDELLHMKKISNVSFLPVKNSRKITIIKSESDKCPRRYCAPDIGLLRLVSSK